MLVEQETKQRLPDFMIVGEMKCGSTTLWDLIASDPRVYCDHDKELHFFASYRYFGGSGPEGLGDVSSYASHFAGASDDQLVGEATPNYMFDLHAPARIYSVTPDARLLVILRDPVKRAWSHYWHQVRRGFERLSFEKALDAEDDRVASGDLQERDCMSYRTRGHYVRSLERLAEVFPREQILVLTLEGLNASPESALSSVSSHLRLGEPLRPPESVVHSNKADFPKWPGLDARLSAAKARAERLPPFIGAIADGLARATRPLRRHRDSGRMKPGTERRLRAAYRDSDRALEAWLGAPAPWADLG